MTVRRQFSGDKIRKRDEETYVYADHAELEQDWLSYMDSLGRNPRTIEQYQYQIRRYLEDLDDQGLKAWEMNGLMFDDWLKIRQNDCRSYRSVMYPAKPEAEREGCLRSGEMDARGKPLVDFPRHCGAQCPLHQKATPKSMENSIKAISGLYRAMAKSKAIPSNWFANYQSQTLTPMLKGLRKKEVHRKGRFWKLNDVHALLTGVQHPPRRAIYTVAAKTGMRLHELEGLRVHPDYWKPNQGYGEIPDKAWGVLPHRNWRSIDDAVLLKRQGERKFVIDAELKALLAPYMKWREERLEERERRMEEMGRVPSDDGTALFVTQYGEPFTLPNQLANQKTLHKDQYRLGLTPQGAPRHERLTLHGARRFFSNWLLHSGINRFYWNVFRGDELDPNMPQYTDYDERHLKQEYHDHGPKIDPHRPVPVVDPTIPPSS